jgi:ADP-ribose pyrophosphatase
MPEETTHSEYLYRGKILKLRLDQVRLENHHVVAREIVEHRGAVAIVALDEQNRVLMVRQHRPGAGRELLEIPAGTLEEGEEPALCATRELKEETGYSAMQWENLGYFFSSPGFCTEKMYLLLAQQLTPGKASPDDDELLTVESLPLAQAMQKIEQGEIVDAKTIIGLMRVWKLLGARR